MSKNGLEMEKRMADVLSDYIDLLNSGGEPNVEEILCKHGDIASELKPLLAAAGSVSHGARRVSLSDERKEALYKRIVVKTNPAMAGPAPQKASAQKGRALEISQRTDFLILMLSSFRSVWGTTRVFKNLFLMGKEARLDVFVPDYYAYQAYNFGPYEESIYRDIEALEKRGLIVKKHPVEHARGKVEELDEETSPEKVDAIYELTDKGKRVAAALEQAADVKDPVIMEKIRELRDKYGSLPLKELLRYIYTEYPEYAEKSIIREEILGSKEDEASDGK